jgi:DnaK suppressor protein
VSDLSSPKKEDLRQALLDLRDELSRMLSSSEEAAAPVDLEAPIGRISRMDAMQEQSMAMANRRAARARMKQVEAALVRFDDDEYGDCLDCGETIDGRRLAAKPESPFCLGCQSGREQRR